MVRYSTDILSTDLSLSSIDSQTKVSSGAVGVNNNIVMGQPSTKLSRGMHDFKPCWAHS